MDGWVSGLMNGCLEMGIGVTHSPIRFEARGLACQQEVGVVVQSSARLVQQLIRLNNVKFGFFQALLL